MVDFDSQSSVYIALTACTVSVSAFALAAMRYGIPTSESHGMIAALAGAGIVTQNSLKVINGVSVLKALLGLVLSVVLAVILGYIITLIIKKATANVKISNKLLDGAQTFSLCVSSFLHGAQDGQKFLAVLLLSAAGSGCAYKTITALIIATALSIGTRFGGKKILTAIGFSLAPLDKRQGLSADITSSLTLTLCSIFGIPSSTTQTVSSAIVGSALYNDYKTINFGIVKNLMFAWLVTFPFCFLLSAFVASIIKLLI